MAEKMISTKEKNMKRDSKHLKRNKDIIKERNKQRKPLYNPFSKRYRIINRQ